MRGAFFSMVTISREYDLGALRSNIGVIFQDFVRYQMTAAENIAVGRIEAADERDSTVRRELPRGTSALLRFLRFGEASPGIP